jgi:kanamycin kinase
VTDYSGVVPEAAPDLPSGLPPLAGVPVPPAVAAVAGGRKLVPVWDNEAGGLTFGVGEGSFRCFVKWAPTGSGIDLAAEADRMTWAGQFHPVPRPLERGSDATGSWLVTAALHGSSAVSPRWIADPATAVTAIGAGLRALHDALPAERCPFSWGADERVADARRQAADGRLDRESWHESHQGLTVAEALERVAAIPLVDKLVVCHGDACAPNTLLAGDGRWSGHVDLGLLGVADRWADLAVATWSAEWNYGPGWEERLLDAYGIGPDPERSAYYRLLWDLSS